MLKESKTCQVQTEEQVLQIQSDLEKVHDALDRANGELYEKFCEANQIEFELQIWKSIAEQLEENLKQNHQMRREVEASLLAQTEVELNLKQEKESLSHQLEEKDERIDNLQKQLVEVNESVKVVENAGAETETSFGIAEGGRQIEKHEAENLHQLVEEKDQRIYDLQQLVASLEQEFDSSTACFSSRLSQMQTEMTGLRKSWEQIKAAEVFKEMEIQEKNLMIVELENDLGSSKTKIQEIEVQLEKKELELRRLVCELEAKISTSDKTIKKLRENSMNLSSENKNLVNSMDSLSERMERLTAEDMQLMESLGKIVQAIDVSRPSQPGFNSDDEDDYDDPVKENMSIIVSSPLTKRVEAIHDNERSPLRAIKLNS
ncbi:UNVERIFIED_CONTAM: hypothetical protein Sradi_0850400 [Sesamum radiatum]|uniref:Uncharacterized protein n=1 Tax=Sesamum radiatum TaxID=300843 RepID=A0AAW2V1G8_SESRA